MTNKITEPYLFEEKQRFRQPWLWFLMGAISTILSVILYDAFYTQFYLGRPWGDNPMSDKELIIFGIFQIIVIAGLPLFLGVIRLTARLDGRHLYIHYFPLRNKKIPLHEISRFEARTYRPILDYGGWGIKYGGRKKGWVYNIDGNRGVFLELTNGKRIMLGSQRAEELALALERAKRGL